MVRSLFSRPSLVLAALLTSIVATACGGSSDGDRGDGRTERASAGGTPEKGDWVFIWNMSDPQTLNYLTSTDAVAQEIHGYMYESLTTTDWEAAEPIPWIADSLPRISDDKLSYEFSIRKEAKFADGTPVTGEDFIFFLKALKNPYITNAAPLRSYYTRVDRAELIDNDPYRLRVVMSEPYYLGHQYAGGLLAMPKHIWDPENLSDKVTFEELNNADPNKNPAIQQLADAIQDVNKGMSAEHLIGSGLYKFDKWVRNDRVELVRNENYWNSDHKWGKAYPDRLIWKTINDANAAVAALKSGNLDFYSNIEKVLYVREKPRFAQNNIQPAEYDYPSYAYIGYNQGREMFADKRVRNALAHALNRQEIIKSIYFGYARPIESPIGYRRPEADTTLPIIQYDLAKAKQLLAEAGWTDSNGDGILDKDGKPFRFTILLNSGNKRRESIAIVFINELKKIGIDASTQSLDWALFLDRTRDGEYDAYIGGWAMNVQEGDMYQIWHSESAENGGSNYVKFKNDRVDALIEGIRSEFDYEKRKEMYKQIQQIIYEEQPYNFLVTEKYTGGVADRFENVNFYAPRPCYFAGEWWVPRGRQKYATERSVAATQ